VEELRGDPIVGLAPRSGPEIKNRSNSAKDGVPERLRRGTEVTNVSSLHRGSAVLDLLMCGGPK